MATREKLWTTEGLGLPEDFKIDGLMSVEGGRVQLAEGTTFTDYGNHGEVSYEKDSSHIIIGLVRQKKGLGLLAARVLNSGVGLLDKFYSMSMGIK